MKPSTRTRSSGFTLTEVLVVITIVIVLAAITMVATKAFREKAGAAVCVQNLRQIGVGLHSYIAENNGRFPDGTADVSWTDKGMCWYDAAAQNMGREYVPYHQGDPLPNCFGCPSGHGKAYEPSWPYTGDYAANLRLGRPGDGVMTLSSVKNPAATPYVQDTVKQNQWGEWIFDKGFRRPSNKPSRIVTAAAVTSYGWMAMCLHSDMPSIWTMQTSHPTVGHTTL